MTLSVRSNGALISAAWFNDIRDLLVGNMLDQAITPKASLYLQAIAATPGSAPSAALAAGTNLGIGVYKYSVAYTNANGSTLMSSLTSITTTSGNQNVNLSSIPTGPTGTASRTLYRSKVGGTTMYVLATINDNTTTTYADVKADSALTVLAPTYPSMGGTLQLNDNTGAGQVALSSDGQLTTTGGLTIKSGGTVTISNNVALSGNLVVTNASIVTVNGNPVGQTIGGSGRIFVQTATPGSPLTGDLWVKV